MTMAALASTNASPTGKSGESRQARSHRIFESLPALGTKDYLDFLKGARRDDPPAAVLVRAYRHLHPSDAADEFAHSKQWIERPQFFDGKLAQQKGPEIKPGITMQQKVDDGDPLLKPGGVFKPVKKTIKGAGNLTARGLGIAGDNFLHQ